MGLAGAILLETALKDRKALDEHFSKWVLQDVRWSCKQDVEEKSSS